MVFGSTSGHIAALRDTNVGFSGAETQLQSNSASAHGLHADASVFIVDGDPVARRALSLLLGFEFVVRAYDSPTPFLEDVRPDTPGCILLDLVLPGASGLELQSRLIGAGCLQPVVFLSRYGSVRTSVQAMRAGALDFIEKPWDDLTLLGAIRRGLERDREARQQRHAAHSICRRVASLTARESQVFRHIIAGRLNKQIAARLGTAEKTIKVHRARVMQKMAVRSVAELTRTAEFVGIRPER
jgi:FixJ family two-component response regulator